MTDSSWATIAELERWLSENGPEPAPADRTPAADRTRLLLQILKISEEAGEVAEAVIGAMGQNPRKGFSHSWEDVESELYDVIITSMVALTSLNPDAGTVFAQHLARVAERAFGPSR
ncbi:MazG-like family protein [Streptacidiphilus rugosus]|uniref:MazG-like family protein n=1 Tax=Streptacidiphilus rugosus TaxID=405783 RepID=UPI00056418A6|nr:MazG-like family protein [Streptacidiphilus rugosus]